MRRRACGAAWGGPGADWGAVGAAVRAWIAGARGLPRAAAVWRVGGVLPGSGRWPVGGGAVARGRGPGARGGGGRWPARGAVSPGGPPAAARRRPTAVFVRGATETAPDGFGIPGNTMGLATGTSAGLRAGHDVCRAPGSAARWGRAGRKLADARGRCDLLRGR